VSEKVTPVPHKKVTTSSRDDQVQCTWGVNESQDKYYLQSIILSFPEAIGPFPGPVPDKVDEFSQKQLTWLVTTFSQKLEENKKKQKKQKPLKL